MAKKLTPTKQEATRLLKSLEQVVHLRRCGLDVRMSIHGDATGLTERELLTRVDTLVVKNLPTFLLIRLATIAEECTNVLWSRRFPEIKPGRLSTDEKLSILEKIHRLNVTALREVWKLRNECVHQSTRNITWAEFGVNFNKVFLFVDRYTGRYMKRPSLEPPDRG